MAKPNTTLNNVSAALRNQAAAEPRFTSIDQRLGGLGASISDALDDLADGGEGEPGAPDADAGADEAREAPPAEPASTESDGDGGEGVVEPAAAAPVTAASAGPVGDPFRVKAKPDTSAPATAPADAAATAPATPGATSTAVTEPPSSGGVDPAVTAALSVLDSDVIDAIKKYTKIEDIKTPEQLRAATKLVGRWLWDTTRALSEKTRAGETAPAASTSSTDPAAPAKPAAPSAPVTDPVLIHYNTKIQSCLADGKKAADEKDAWVAIERQKLAVLEDLKQKRARGESFDDSALTQAYEDIHDAQKQQTLWLSKWSAAQAAWEEATVNRTARADALALTERATRQEQEATQRATQQAANDLTELVGTRVTEYSKTYFVPEKNLPYVKNMMQGLLVQERLATGKPFTQESLAAFLESKVKEYASEHGFTQAQQKQVYNTEKTADAPRPVPAQKKTPGMVRPQATVHARPAGTPAPSLRHLEQEIMNADIDG